MQRFNYAKLFFWAMLALNTVNSFFGLEGYSGGVETYFPIIEALQFPIIIFTLIALFSLAYGTRYLSQRTYRIIASAYLASSLYDMLMPVIVYWEQQADITIHFIVFLFTDLIIFMILWRNSNVTNDNCNSA